MLDRKRARAKKTKNLPDWAKDIKKLSTVLHCATQEEFAVKLRSKQGTVSTWLRGDEARRPSADTFVRMAGLAAKLDPELASRFLRRANISDDAIFSVARTLDSNRFAESAPLIQKGEIVLVPRVRETAEGRQEAGSPVPLPAEFVPNPAATVCVMADDSSTALVDCPRGAVLLDTSWAGVEDVRDLWDRVVMLKLTPAKHFMMSEPGIYVGRLHLEGSQKAYGQADARLDAFLGSLTQMAWALTDIGYYVEAGAMKDIPLDDREGKIRQWAEVRARAYSAFRFFDGVQILGKVTGRFTGHLGI